MVHRRAIFFMMFLLAWFFMFLIAMEVFFRASGVAREDVVGTPWFIIFTQVMVFLVPLAVWLAIFREKLNAHLPHMKLGTRNIIYIVGMSIFLQPAMMVISGLTNFIFPNEVGEFLAETAVAHPYWLLILAIAVTPAICEEVVFRGYIRSVYKNKTFLTMALMNGFFFAIIHLNPQQFPYTFVMGIIFTYMVYATRSIRAGVISHFVLNASQITLIFGLNFLVEIAEDLGDEFYEAIYAAEEINWSDPEMIVGFIMLGVIALGATAAAVILFREFHKHNKARFAAYDARGESISNEETPLESEIEPAPASPPEQKRKDRIIDAALILVVVAMYLLLVIY